MSNIITATEKDLDQTDLNRLTWMKCDEAADYLRKTPNALRIMVSRGYIRPRRLRRRKQKSREIKKIRHLLPNITMII